MRAASFARLLLVCCASPAACAAIAGIDEASNRPEDAGTNGDDGKADDGGGLMDSTADGIPADGTPVDGSTSDTLAAPDSPAADATVSTCNAIDSQNASFQPSGGSGSGLWFASQYVPTTGYVIRALALFNSGGSIALLDSSSNSPGAVLATGTLPLPQNPPSWTVGVLSAPIVLTAGHKYFIATSSLSFSSQSGCTAYATYRAFSVNGSWTLENNTCMQARECE
jgi:hypothetical protein